ncbi:MAG TPA: class I lanthipeptide [Thermoanaerobaculia bacterium]|nr:class I lanthipeptide [Thermoanaerobaculia bacterium]
MKKKTRKLNLNRETISSLDRAALGHAAGAGTSEECIVPTGCECGSDGCIGPSWQHTCGTVCDIPSWHC